MFLFGLNDILPKTPLEVVGMVLSSIAVLIFIFSAIIIKSKKKLLMIQCLAHAFLIFSEIISKAWSSIIQEIISIIRNICIFFNKNTNVVSWVLIGAGFVFGIYCCIFGGNTFTPWKGVDLQPWYSYLPIIANTEYSIVALNKNLGVKWLKLSFAISSTLWGINFFLCGPALFIAGLLNLLSGLMAYIAFFRMVIKKEVSEE